MPGAHINTLNAALTAVGARGAWLSLHTADPGKTGASELTGGANPAYARKQTTWQTASAGVMTGTAQTLDVPASRTITHFGVWTAASGGEWVTGGVLRNAANTQTITESYTEQGQYALTPRLTADDIAVT